MEEAGATPEEAEEIIEEEKEFEEVMEDQQEVCMWRACMDAFMCIDRQKG